MFRSIWNPNILIPTRYKNVQLVRSFLDCSGQSPNNLPKEAPTFVPILIRDKVAIKDSIKRIEVQTPSNVVKDVIAPTVDYFNPTRITEKILPTTKTNEENFKYCDYYRYGHVVETFSMHLIKIKRRKMKKHQRRKWRKKYRSDALYRAKKREIRKEKNFRAELLAEIRKAENFSAKSYVEGVLKTIERAPQENTDSLSRLFDLMRKHKFETTQVKPKFDDPVPSDFDKLK